MGARQITPLTHIGRLRGDAEGIDAELQLGALRAPSRRRSELAGALLKMPQPTRRRACRAAARAGAAARRSGRRRSARLFGRAAMRAGVYAYPGDGASGAPPRTAEVVRCGLESV